jgi:hypothetical protein
MVSKRRPWLALALLGACSFGFETPSIVLDLRVLAIVAEPPEIVIDIDPENPEGAAPQLDANPFTIRVLVADPGQTRRLEWDMTACPENNNHRCDDPDAPAQNVGSGIIQAPSGNSGEQPTATFVPSLLVVSESVQADDLLGFGGIPVNVQVRIWPEGQPEQKIYAAKRIFVSPRLPAQRVANTNPVITSVNVGGETGTPLVQGSCASGAVAITVAPEAELQLFPIETEATREPYVLPTYNGGSRSFVENIQYNWYSTSGEWDRESSGGDEGPSGEPPIDTTWTAPKAAQQVPVWVVMRDERGGQAWFEYCVVVQ